MKRFYFVILALTLAACSSEDFGTKSLSEGMKGEFDWVRDAFGQKVTRIPDNVDGPFPAVPVDPRPPMRTEKTHDQMVAALKADQGTGAKIQQALDKSDDPTRYVSFNGAPPTAQSISLTPENVAMPDGVRDIDTVDPSRLDSWSEVASIDFKEGSAELPEDIGHLIGPAVALAAKHLDARVIGYSDSDRLVLPGKGPHEANRYLADLRARKVAEALLKAGVPAAKLVVGSAPEAERKSGDRVEIIIDY